MNETIDIELYSKIAIMLLTTAGFDVDEELKSLLVQFLTKLKASKETKLKEESNSDTASDLPTDFNQIISQAMNNDFLKSIIDEQLSSPDFEQFNKKSNLNLNEILELSRSISKKILTDIPDSKNNQLTYNAANLILDTTNPNLVSIRGFIPLAPGNTIVETQYQEVTNKSKISLFEKKDEKILLIREFIFTGQVKSKKVKQNHGIIDIQLTLW